ncbi:MAG: YeeE/YedE thiosulfate transporter family protein [Prolixibacteraceae bacterium]|jgi:hypothetical protein
MTTLILAGFLFGTVLQTAKLNRFDTISGLAILEDLTVAKAILFTLGISVALFAILFLFGWVNFHVKPLLLVGVLLGGLVFGAGMAILGYCPGTLVVSAGEGAVDAMLGIVGGLLGGIAFSLTYPKISWVLGADYGNLSVFTLAGSPVLYLIIAILVSVTMIALAFYLDKIKPLNKRWILAGAALALLNVVISLKFTYDRPVGASTAYPYLGGLTSELLRNTYFDKIEIPGAWESYFLLGALLAGLIISLVTKNFRFQLIFSRWAFYKGTAPLKRIIWALSGGFILIFGARLAGGCTSGHIISGGMQLAVSSMLFAVAAFSGLLVSGRIFYKK